jgi:hypothetical protein
LRAYDFLGLEEVILGRVACSFEFPLLPQADPSIFLSLLIEGLATPRPLSSFSSFAFPSIDFLAILANFLFYPNRVLIFLTFHVFPSFALPKLN